MDLFEAESYQMLLHSAECLVQEELPQTTEISEQKRILRDCSKAFHNSFNTQTVNVSYTSLLNKPKLKFEKSESLEDHASRMPLIVSSTTVKSSDGENLVIFWKNASKTPFGPVLGEKLLKQLDTAILELQSAYKPPKPPATDKRHKNAEKPATCLLQKPGVCGLYHFAWWFAQGQAKTKAPVISAHLIETAYK